MTGRFGYAGYVLLIAGVSTSLAADPLPIALSTTTALSSDASPCSSRNDVPLRPFVFEGAAPLQYRVKWGALSAGKGTIAVVGRETLDGKSLIHVSMAIQTTGLVGTLHHYDEQSDSWIDPQTSLTFRYTKKTREAHYQQDEVVTLNQACRQFQRDTNRLDKGIKEHFQGTLPDETLDILSYLFYARELPLAEGAEFNMTLMSGDHLWPVVVRVGKKVSISVSGHRYVCFYLEPEWRPSVAQTSKLSQLQLWITTDQRRLPVRLRMQANVGHINADLVEDR